MKTVAIDFDGVVHAYSKGWQDGSIYDEPVPGAFDAIASLMEQGYSVFIFSTRSPRQIKKWIKKQIFESEYQHDGMGGDPDDYIYPIYSYDVQVIPFWTKFWNKKNVLGVTRRKLAAQVYIDDRAYRFNGNWIQTLLEAPKLKTWQERPTHPTTLAEAVENLMASWDDHSKSEFLLMSEDQALTELHHGTGRNIRNDWGLWTGSPLALHFNEMGIHHADDMSSMILTCLHRALCNKHWDIEGQVKSYQDFWASQK